MSYAHHFTESPWFQKGPIRSKSQIQASICAKCSSDEYFGLAWTQVVVYPEAAVSLIDCSEVKHDWSGDVSALIRKCPNSSNASCLQCIMPETAGTEAFSTQPPFFYGTQGQNNCACSGKMRCFTPSDDQIQLERGAGVPSSLPA